MKPISLDEIAVAAGRVDLEPWGLGYPNFDGNPEAMWGYNRFLHWFVYNHRPGLVIECGVYMGTATEHMAVAYPYTLVVGVDIKPHSAFYGVVQRNRNVRLVTGDARLSLEGVKHFAEDRKLGLLFLDSTHDGTTAQMELEVYSELMGEECLVAADDIRGYPAMEIWWNSLQYPKLDLSFLHMQANEFGVPTGFGVFIVRR
jgi:cephalosporin hydroxylase